MKLHNVLLRHAATLASSQTVRRVEIYAEIGKRQARPMTEKDTREMEALQADADNCGEALRRFGSYRPDRDPSCPYCWIVKGEHATVFQTERPDLYRCSNCEGEYSVEATPAP